MLKIIDTVNEIPSTGDKSYVVIIVAGVLLLVCATLIVYRIIKTGKKK